MLFEVRGDSACYNSARLCLACSARQKYDPLVRGAPCGTTGDIDVEPPVILTMRGATGPQQAAMLTHEAHVTRINMSTDYIPSACSTTCAGERMPCLRCIL